MSAAVHMLPAVKLRSMRFIRQMFRDRGYRVKDVFITLFDERQDLWQLYTETQTGERVVAVFASCNAFGTDGLVPMDADIVVTKVEPRDARSSLIVPVGHLNARNTKTGTDYIKSLVKFARDQAFKVVILVTDFMTPQASKLMLKTEGVRLTHFMYNETGIEHLADHITQPVVFRALTGPERAAFVAQHPRYRIELLQYSYDDALVKYYNMVIGDIIFIQDNDRQSGLVEEYGLVVEHVT